MTKKIVKRTDANNETLYFYTHSDAVDVGDGSSTKSLTEVIDDTLHKSAQTLTNAEKTQVHANLGLNGVDDVPTENSNNIVRSGGVKAAIDDVVDDFTNRGFMYKGIAPASAPLGEDKTFYIAKSGDYTAYTGIGDGSFTLNGIAVLTYATATTSGAWTKNDIVLFDDEPTAESQNLVKSGGVQNELALGAVYDVSAKNPTAGLNNDGKFESLSALLSDTNLNTLIPTSVRKGGMSVKYVQSSDNKYVQCRLMATDWSTDTDDWSICHDTTLIENPEFVEVTTDKDNKVLWGVKSDGNFYFGAGCPPQVKEYLESKIVELHLTSVPDILTFLGNIEETTLADLLAGKISLLEFEAGLALKVDKVDGKSLIDSDVADNVEFIENPEFIQVTTDVKGKVIEATKKDGKKVFYAGIEGMATEEDIFRLEQEHESLAQKTDKLFISGKELFVVGDSLSAGGVWEATVAELTGCIFDQNKNIKPGSQISTGGTITFGGKKDSGLARILNIKKEGYHPDIILLQNVNDSAVFNNNGETSSGTINDEPYIINQILEGYYLSDWENNAVALLSSISSVDRKFGTSLQLLKTASGKNLKILTTATTEGDITIGVRTSQTGWLYYNIHVLTSDTISDIIDKILEYNYSMVTDTIGNDNMSVNFSSGSETYPCSISFTDVGNTGVTATITDVNDAQTVEVRVFKGDDLTTDWEDPNKWDTTITFYAAWKGMIEFAKINFPQAEVAVLLFPRYAMTPSNYINADGTFDQESYNADNKKFEGMFAAQKEVAEIYNVPVIDIQHKCGITVGNYNEYYYDGNVHPKEKGYVYFGKKVAKELLNLI